MTGINFARKPFNLRVGRLALLVCLQPLLLLGCAVKGPVPPPQAADSAAIGINIKISPPLPLPPFPNPHDVYFIKLAPGSSDPTANGKIVASNFFWNNRAYLLNAEPGEYVAIAISFSMKGGKSRVSSTKVSSTKRVTVSVKANINGLILFPQSMIDTSRVRVGSRSIAYMGNLVVDLPSFPGVGSGDAAQQYFAKSIQARHHYKGVQNSAENSEALKSAFMSAARDDLKGSAWESRLK